MRLIQNSANGRIHRGRILPFWKGIGSSTQPEEPENGVTNNGEFVTNDGEIVTNG